MIINLAFALAAFSVVLYTSIQNRLLAIWHTYDVIRPQIVAAEEALVAKMGRRFLNLVRVEGRGEFIVTAQGVQPVQSSVPEGAAILETIMVRQLPGHVSLPMTLAMEWDLGWLPMRSIRARLNLLGHKHRLRQPPELDLALYLATLGLALVLIQDAKAGKIITRVAEAGMWLNAAVTLFAIIFALWWATGL